MGLPPIAKFFWHPGIVLKVLKDGFDQTSEQMFADASMRKIIHSLWMSSVNHV